MIGFFWSGSPGKPPIEGFVIRRKGFQWHSNTGLSPAPWLVSIPVNPWGYVMVIFCGNHWFSVKITNCDWQFPWLHIPEPLEMFPTSVQEGLSLYSSRGVKPRLLRRSKVPLLSSFAVVWYSSGHVEPVHSLASLVAAAKVVLMLEDRIGNAESPQWLFMNSSWKTKSIRLSMLSHGYWLAVPGCETGEAMWLGWGEERAELEVQMGTSWVRLADWLCGGAARRGSRSCFRLRLGESPRQNLQMHLCCS